MKRQIRIAERTGARVARRRWRRQWSRWGLPAGERSAMVQRFVQALTVLEQTDDEA